MLCKESGNIRQREDYLPSLVCLYALQVNWKHQAERRLPTFTSLSLCSANKVETSGREKTTYLHFSISMLCKLKWKYLAESRLHTFTCLSLCSANEVETSGREKTSYLHFSISLLCKLKWKHQAERRLPIFTCLSLCSASKVETSGRKKTTNLHLSISMLCKESGNIKQREDYLPSLVCLYALQVNWKHQAERRLPTFTSLSLCSAKKVETSAREKTT